MDWKTAVKMAVLPIHISQSQLCGTRLKSQPRRLRQKNHFQESGASLAA
jgi:hypothetical protein